MKTTLQIRIDSKDKVEAQKILKKYGITLSDAIRMFIKEIVVTKKFPFKYASKN